MKVIVGLGNPGEKYERTRHNLGFMAVERFFQDFEPIKRTVWQNDAKFKSDIAEIFWQPKHGEAEKVILVKPKTYMNNSGMAVELLASFYKIAPEDIWIVHDEIDLPTGMLKIRMGGSSAGHRGIESIIEKLGTEKFWRFRLGIGETHNHHGVAGQKIKAVDEYVLGTFGDGQAGKTRELLKRTSKAIMAALEDGLESAQNRFNTK